MLEKFSISNPVRKNHTRVKKSSSSPDVNVGSDRDACCRRNCNRWLCWELCYIPEACLQFKDQFHIQVKNACHERQTRNVGLKMSKVVMVGDLYVGKTCLINRFCKNVFDRDYKATIGVDFEIERFEVGGIPYNLQIWDTAGQEKFKCIASAYYRGTEVIIIAFDLADIQTLEHTKQWLEDARMENEQGLSTIFLVGCKKDVLSQAEYERTEADAIKVATEMQAEYWAVSSKTGENVREFFFRVAALAFEASLLKELERNDFPCAKIGEGNTIRMDKVTAEYSESRINSTTGCC
ncbi:ras-related protein Rab-36 isoform X1 [Chiloscyllium punctatum]|uniref:ras-related protein Rab-36 isoform X1 n=1 Tax=Chiloscyllium punctatum TaxID=137246 RepID=UPI003B638992